MQLPETYEKKMRALLGEDEFSLYKKSLETKGRPGVRANLSKVSSETLQEIIGVPLSRVPWIPEGFLYDETVSLSKHPYYYAGLYYLQEPSAMTPAFVLSAKPGDRVLDLCAAPGGKSTAIAGALQGEGLLVSNDISHSRAKALLKNLELAGIKNMCVTSESPDRLAARFPEFFDKVLVDAPCSGEGMFRRDPDMIASWKERGPESYIPIQREILLQAVKLLKPGGTLVYSTCTFDREEDEGNVQWLLDICPQMEMDAVPLFDGAAPGFGLSGCLRLFPHKICGEGHFLAKLKKRAEDTGNDVRKDTGEAQNVRPSAAAKDTEKQKAERYHKTRKTESGNQTGVYPQIEDVFQFISWKLEPSRLFRQQDALYLLPEGFPDFGGIRCLRTGLLLGELKKDRFEPSQALAMALKTEEYSNTFSLPKEDERVIRYLKGETLAFHDTEAKKLKKGWCLVAVDGYPLGFAKAAGQTLKNKYYAGWRWQ